MKNMKDKFEIPTPQVDLPYAEVEKSMVIDFDRLEKALALDKIEMDIADHKKAIMVKEENLNQAVDMAMGTRIGDKVKKIFRLVRGRKIVLRVVEESIRRMKFSLFLLEERKGKLLEEAGE